MIQVRKSVKHQRHCEKCMWYSGKCAICNRRRNIRNPYVKERLLKSMLVQLVLT